MGVVGVSTGVTLLLTSPPPKEKAGLSLAAGPGTARVTWRF
jgi:hypothetical protein